MNRRLATMSNEELAQRNAERDRIMRRAKKQPKDKLIADVLRRLRKK